MTQVLSHGPRRSPPPQFEADDGVGSGGVGWLHDGDDHGNDHGNEQDITPDAATKARQTTHTTIE